MGCQHCAPHAWPAVRDLVLPAARGLCETALQAWLQAMPAGVLRLKGVVQTGAGQWSELQFAGRSGRLRAASAPVQQQQVPAIVAIGLAGQLPVAALQALVAGAAGVRAAGRPA